MKKSKPSQSQSPSGGWRNRITGLEQHRPSDVLDHPFQWRTHPANQVNALRGVLEEVGIAGALVAYHSERASGVLVKIDGHARAGLSDTEWPVLVLDVDDAEADLLLATYDPLSAMAAADKEQLDALLQQVESGDAAIQGMLAELAQQTGIVPPQVEFKEYDESVADEVEYITCPECGHKWPK